VPSRQPVAAIERLEDPLLRAYAEAWARVVALHDAIESDPRQWRKRDRLRAAADSIVRSMDRLDAKASAWLRTSFPEVYSMGEAAGRADAVRGGAPSAFHQVDEGAARRLADDLFQDLLQATDGVRKSTKRLVREVIRDEALNKAIAGDTAEAASREARRVLERAGVHAVRYADGSRHGLEEYTRMAVRTKTGVAYNTAAVNGAAGHGVKYFEVFDGPFCGWAFHDDRQALGMIVTADESLAYPISHPNCRRAFGARPDVSTKAQAKEAQSSTTEGQRAAQEEQDRQRAEAQRRRRASQERRGRREAAAGTNAQAGSPRASRRAQRLAKRGARLAPPSG
jgi:hypothetical protein